MPVYEYSMDIPQETKIKTLEVHRDSVQDEECAKQRSVNANCTDITIHLQQTLPCLHLLTSTNQKCKVYLQL